MNEMSLLLGMAIRTVTAGSPEPAVTNSCFHYAQGLRLLLLLLLLLLIQLLPLLVLLLILQRLC